MNVYLILIAMVLFCLPLRGQKRCIKNDCTNGLGVCVYQGLGEYSGEFKNGLPHGQGKFSYENGDKYLGTWAAGKKEGRGKYVFQNGLIYNGEFKDDFFNGHGTMYFTDQSRYEGGWNRGKRHGPGIWFLPDGDLIEGYWIDGQYQADWSHLAFNGQEGTLQNCNVNYCHNIEGKFQYPDGKKFLGNFKGGIPEGVGTVYYPNGDLYEGYWFNDQPDGRGIMYYSGGEAVGAVWDDGEARRKLFTQKHDGQQSVATKQVKIWAVIIGIADYTRMHKLDFTDDDAQRVYEFLRSPNGGNLDESQIEMLVDKDATREKVINTVQKVYGKADENDVILFYFSGHGVKGAFLPIDSDGFNNRIEHFDLKQYINLSPAKHKLIIADACHAGTFSYKGGSSLAGFLKKYYSEFEVTTGGTALLMSSKGEEYSFEDNRLKSGIFSYFLIEGLKGNADEDDNGIVTVSEVFDYVREEVAAFTRGAQSPILMGNFDKNMPVAIIGKR